MNTENADRIVDAALGLAAETGWLKLTMHEIAARAGMPLSELYAAAPYKHAILCRLSDKVNRAVLAGAPPSADETPRERLFEVLMKRLDALTPYKPGLRAIAKDLPRDPGSAVLLSMLVPPAMAWMLEAARIPATGWRAPLRVLGLTQLYTRLLKVWMDDDSEEGGKTMAELDRLLKKAEGWAKTMSRRTA